MTTAACEREPAAVFALVAAVAAGAVGLGLAAGGQGWAVVAQRPAEFAAFAATTLALQLASAEVHGRGRYSLAATGMLATGLAFGIGPAIAVAAGAAIVNPLRHRPRPTRALFDVGQWILAAGAAAAAAGAFHDGGWGAGARLGPALAAAFAFLVVNVGLLAHAMAFSERRRALDVWRERLRWATPYSLAAGPLALALALAYEKLGLLGLGAFALPPLFMMLSVRQYLVRTRTAVAEVERRNDDLEQLFRIAGGLAARAHDLDALVEYVEGSLGQLTGAEVRLSLAAEREALGHSGALELVSGGRPVGWLTVDPSDRRWERLRDAVCPQLATALESAQLAERLRKTHRDTIATLSRSMEAKDSRTGDHTGRVAAVSLELARRLGYGGGDLDAIEIGALLHDIGKIGIPERILHKPGPLDEDEWAVMREHPAISATILSALDLHPFVLQIARSSHERLDGRGYPDRLAGDDIPLPARIVLVADALDALTSDRPYRAGRPLGEALAELRRHAGTQFCPQVVAALEALVADEPERFAAAPSRRLLRVA